MKLILIFRTYSWVLTVPILSTQEEVSRMLFQWYRSNASKYQQQDMGVVISTTNEVLRVSGLHIIQEYIHRKQNTVINYVSTRSLLDIFLAIGKVGGVMRAGK